MFRQHAQSGEPELDQIGSIISVDITSLYDMENYGSESGEELEFMLNMAESEEEKKQILDQAKQSREKLQGNLDIVLDTINQLIGKLSHINNLHQLLNDNGRDTISYDPYFTNFNTDTGDGYIRNNFGHDLRNFKSYLEYAKTRGARTVYFIYG